MTTEKKNGKSKAKSGKSRGAAGDFGKFIVNLLNTSDTKSMTVQELKSALRIPKTTLYRHLKKLKDQGIILNHYPVWKLVGNLGGYREMGNVTVPDNKLQLHNLSFIVTILKKPDWWMKRHNQLTRLKEYHFRDLKLGMNPYQQMQRGDFIIQVFSNSLIFISTKNYYGYDSYDIFIESVKDFLAELDYFERKIKFKFFYDNVPSVRVRSQHYVHLRNVISEKCKQDGTRFEVYIDGKRRLWVDFSEPLGVEAGHQDFAVEDISLIKSHYEDILRYAPPKNSEIATHLRSVMGCQELTNKQINVILELIKLNLPIPPKETEEEIKGPPDYVG